MAKEWYTAKELAGVAHFPSTPQAINLKAKNENWRKQKREGVKGKGVEYHISNLPNEVANALIAREAEAFYRSDATLTEHAWAMIYFQMNDQERDKIMQFVMRHGIKALLEKVK